MATEEKLVERLREDNDWLMRSRFHGHELRALHAGNNILRAIDALTEAEARVAQLENWPGDQFALYETVHNAAIAAYEAATPPDYRYSASALRRAVDTAIKAALSQSPDRESGT